MFTLVCIADLLQAHRKALLDIMTSFIPIDNVKFSKRLSEVRELPNAVELRFADGEVAKASILVGADGIQSIVREQVLKHTHPDQVAPVYANSYCYRGVIPIAQAEDILGDLTDVAKFYFGDKRSCVTYRISGGEVRRLNTIRIADLLTKCNWQEFNFLLCVADEGQTFKEKDAVTVQVSHETMMADFGGDGVDERFLRLLETAKPIKWGLFHHRYTSTYFRDRMVLIGDSAHASLPFQAAGAGQGVEDALILSKVLAAMIRAAGSTAPSLSQIYAGLGAYDAVRRPRAQKQLEQSAELGLMIHFQDPDAGVQMEKILPRLQHGRFEWLWFRDLREDVQAVEQRLAATGDS